MRGALAVCLLLLVGFLDACPTNETLYQNCQCESSHNGILLDCSNRNAAQTLTLLRENQQQLGLIQQLTMRNASIEGLPANFLIGLYVKKLDLSMNDIEQIHPKAFEGVRNIIQSLVLSHNNITVLPVDALDGMVGLLSLNLANNSIGDLSNQLAFRNLPKLFDLNLGNNRICDIQKAVFGAVKHSVQTLNLGHNCLTTIPAPAIRGFQQLIALHLHNNHIKQLDPLEFMNLPLLNLINLAWNNISSIHRQSFLNVPNLRLMYLSNNLISSLEPNQFRHFAALELLDLTENRIQVIPKEAFANMRRLAYLYLGQNMISKIEQNAFVNSSAITILLLPQNKLTKLSTDMFTGLTNLQQFNVKNNMIAQIDQNAFYQTPSLVMLDLSYNKLTILEPATFLSQLNMFFVDLSHNHLLTTPYSAFNKRVVTVVLKENPLVCTERVHMLQNGVGVYIPNTIDVICGGVDPKKSVVTGTNPRIDNSVLSAVGSAFVQDTKTTTTPPLGQTIIRPISTVWPPRGVTNRPLLPTSQQSVGPLQTARPLLPGPGVRLPPLAGQAASRPAYETSGTLSPAVQTRFTHFRNRGRTQPPSPFNSVGGVPLNSGLPPSQLRPNVNSTSLLPNPNSWYTRPPIPPLPVDPANVPDNRWPAGATLPPSAAIAGGSQRPVPRWDPNGPPPNLNGWNPNVPTRNIPANLPTGNTPANLSPGWNPTNGAAGLNRAGQPNTRLPSGANEGWNQNGFTDPLGRGRLAVSNGRTLGPTTNSPPRQVTEPQPAESTSLPYGLATPGGIHPFPVPFLSRGTPVRPAYYATTPLPQQTLPPGIILATARPPDAFIPEWTQPNLRSTVAPWQPNNFVTRPTDRPWQEGVGIRPQAGSQAVDSPLQPDGIPPVVTNAAPKPIAPVRPTINSVQSTPLIPLVDTVPPTKEGAPHADPFDNNVNVAVGETFPYESLDKPDDSSTDKTGGSSSSKSTGPGHATTTIAICLSVVVVLMVGVFVTLCVVRHRSYLRRGGAACSSSSGSSAAAQARTSAYVAAQAAQMNYAASNYATHGTLSRMPLARGGGGPRSQQAATASAAGQHTWIYTPGSYTSASNNFYK